MTRKIAQKIAGTTVAMVSIDEHPPIDQEPGHPEAGLQITMDGHAVPVRPKGNGKPVQMSFDDMLALQHWQDNAQAGIP